MAGWLVALVNRSINAVWLVLALVLVRWAIKSAPKWVICAGWGLVGFKLLFPFAIKSSFSLVPYTSEVMADQGGIAVAQYNSFTPAGQANTALPAGSTEVVDVATLIWAAGIVAMALYAVASYIKLHRLTRERVCIGNSLYICDHIPAPFVLGVFCPKIYLPSNIAKEDVPLILVHEKAHLRRLDHIWKPLGYAILAVYWFNPVIWLAYSMFCKDMELACDEAVLRQLGPQVKKQYSAALVNCSVPGRAVTPCPLAFGEGRITRRVKAALKYQKPAFWVTGIAVGLCLGVGLCFFTAPNYMEDDRLITTIDTAIAAHHQSNQSNENCCCLDWTPIGVQKSGSKITVYMWVLYKEYSYSNNALSEESGAHILTAITAQRQQQTYKVIDYWEPRDGAEYKASIQQKVPFYLWAKAFDSQRYIGPQLEVVEQLAKEYYGIAPAIQSTAPGSDIVEAEQLVQNQIDSWEGCKLYSLQYAGDLYSQNNLDYCNSLAGTENRYTQCAVFLTEFRSPLFGGGAWEANTVYNWTWYLGKTAGGQWELITWGNG